MHSKHFRFFWIYSIIVILELITGSGLYMQHLHCFIKPMLVLSLLCYFVISSTHLQSSTRWMIIFALIASLLGDVLLLFTTTGDQYFIFGLIAFLIAHIIYSLIFLKNRNKSKRIDLFITALVLYATSFVIILKAYLGALLIPVILYVVVITTMAISAYLRQYSISKQSYSWVFTGAILFVVSDSFLAFNKFYMPLPFEHILIMLTYAGAQFAIVSGLILQKN